MIRARISSFDSNGNCILDTNQDTLTTGGIALGDAIGIAMRSGRVLLSVPVLSGYYCKAREALLLVSDGRCEFAVKRGNARAQYGLVLGDELGIELELPKKYWEQENAYSFYEITDENLYSSKEEFANFRPLFGGGTIFYRSASPFDDTYGRAKAVRSCIDKYSIRTIIDVADTPDELAELIQMSSHCPTSGNIYPIGNDAGLYSEEYEQTIVQAIEVIAREEGPFLIHCRAGKRRSGFLCALLQGLAGLDYHKIVADYMVSYANNNGITQESNPQRFDFLKKDTIEKFLAHIGGRSGSDELSSCVKKYLKSLGVSLEVILRLATKLAEDKDPR